MLRVIGRELPNLKIETSVDKTLYIDIDHQIFEPIFELAPTNTYIITNRPLAEIEEVISKGYFNIATITSVSQITPRFITSFISTDYYDNNLKILSTRLLELYSDNSVLIDQLYQALIALRDDNAEQFSKIMSVNLISFIETIDDINSMTSFCKSLNSATTKYSEVVAKSSKVEEALADAERYRRLYEDLLTAKKIVEADKDDLEKQLEGMHAQLTAHTVTDSDVHNHADYKSLQVRLEAISAEKETLKQEFERYKQNAEEQSALADGSGNTALVAHLREEIKKLKEMPLDKTIEERMPFLIESTTLDAEHIVYFKEVRPTVYINSAIHWLISYLKVRYTKAKHKEFLILVLDPLVDQYTVSKYQKHGWSVNSVPSASNHVLVTNCFNYSQLKSLYHIEAYGAIICIDRTHVKTDAINIKRCKKFYMINTTNDIQDYGLEPASCIGFFEKSPAGAIAPRYRIKPWDDDLAKYADIKRAGKFTQDKVLEHILVECEVVDKA